MANIQEAASGVTTITPATFSSARTCGPRTKVQATGAMSTGEKGSNSRNLKLESATRMLLLAKENSPVQVAETPDVGGMTTTDIATLLPLKRQWVVFILINTVKDTPTAESTPRGLVMTETTVAIMAHGKEELKPPWGVWLA